VTFVPEAKLPLQAPPDTPAVQVQFKPPVLEATVPFPVPEQVRDKLKFVPPPGV